MNERHQGYMIDCYYDWLNMLTKLKRNNPRRFYEFYNDQTILYYQDKLQAQHLTPD